jgi:hypothetical protein
MQTRLSLIVAVLSLSLGGFVNANSAAGITDTATPMALEPAGLLEPAGGWIANPREDFICGIDDLAKVSNPARVDYDELLGATKEMKELKHDKVDPESIKGKDLVKRAKTEVTKVCEIVREARGHCGVWKVIRHDDGRIVPNITAEVKQQL